MIAMSLALVYLALHGKPKFLQKLFWLMSLLPPIFVAAFRYENGADYLMYDRMYRSILQTGDFISIKTVEIGFKWMIQICQLFSSKSFLLFAVCAVFIVFFYYRGALDILVDNRSIIISLLLFYATGTYFDSFNGLRQYLAAAIVFWALRFIIEGKFKRWIVTVVCASLFHYTAIIVLPLYLIRKLDFSLKRSLIIIAASWFGGTVVYNVVAWVLQYTRYRYFLTSIEFQVVPTEASMLYTSVITVILFGIDISNRKRKNYSLTLKDQFFLNMQIITVCTALLSWSVPLMWRVQYYFLPVEMLIIPNMLNMVRRKYVRTIIQSLVIGMYVIIVLFGILVNDWYDCVPWNFYFEYVGR